MNLKRLPLCHWHEALSPRRPEQTWRCFPVHCDKCPLQDHLLRKPVVLTQLALSPGRPEWLYRGFPVSVIGIFCKTIFWVSLSYWLNDLGLQEDLNNEQDNLLSTMITSTHWSSVSRSFLCILLIVCQIIPLLTLQHKYGCHIENMSHTAIMLNGHVDPTYLPIATRIQSSATASSHIIAKYVPEQICPLNVTYANYFMCTYKALSSVYILHMNSIQSIMWPKALIYINFTLLAYAPKQICMLHHICMSHYRMKCNF